jgi:type IV pilus assembly protein PilA
MISRAPALRADRRAGEDLGFTLVELLIVVAIVSIIAAIASAGLMRSRAAANEASAIQSIRVTSSSQKAYAVACGRGAYAASYVVLGTPPPGGGPGFISEDLAMVVNPLKSGYTFTLAAGAGSAAGPIDCNGSGTITAFYASAVPFSTSSGARSFAINGNGTIWWLSGPNPPVEPFGPPAAPLQ